MINKLKNKFHNSKHFRFAVSAMAFVLVMAIVSMPFVYELATAPEAEVMANTDETLEKAYPDLLKSPNAGKMGKSETVNVTMNADGTKRTIKCEEWISNGKGLEKLEDVTTLTDIENISGNEEFEADGHSIVWNAKGNDIRYEGVYKGELPVNMEISYYLNGEKVTAKEIAGKEGNVEIHFNYSVNRTTSAEGYTFQHPYTVISAVVLSNEHFADIKTSSGEVSNDGTNTACVGVSMPGMNQNLGISKSDMDFPSEFVVEAYTDKFEIEGTYTIATSGMLADMGTGKASDALDQVASLEGNLKKLSKSSSKLAEGSSDIVCGADDIGDGISALKKGTKSSADGAAELSAGLKALDDNGGSISGGAEQLETAVFTMATEQVRAMMIAAGMPEEAAGAVSLTPDTYKDVIGNMKQTAGEDGQAKLAQLEGMLDQVVQYSAGVKAYTDGVSKSAQGSEELAAGLKELDEGAGNLKKGFDAFNSGLDKFSDGMYKFDEDGIQQLVGSFNDSKIAEISRRFDALIVADEEQYLVGGQPAGLEGASKIIFQTGSVKK